LVTHGANGALGSFIGAFCNKGDVVVSFEPMFPMYLDHIEMNGGIHMGIPLRPNEQGIWHYNVDEMRKILSDPRVRMVIVNSPHNPTGKVFSREEQEEIGKVIAEFPHIVVFSDEVYDFLPFDNKEHIPFACCGDNWKRTVSVYSGGKLFNCTGWKVGWAIGPEAIIRMGGIIYSTVTYTLNCPAQVSIGHCISEAFGPNTKMSEGETPYANVICDLFQKNRDYLIDFLKREDTYPVKPTVVEGGYFLVADISACKDMIPAKYLASHDYLEEGQPMAHKIYNTEGKVPMDVAFCRWMACENKLAIMPNSFFYGKESPTRVENYVRLALCKTHESLKAGAEGLIKK
jgi:aspartate/methionine/tyrosine aminotransferase